MSDLFDVITIETSLRAKRLLLKYCPLKGVVLVRPKKIHQKKIVVFIEMHAQWIEKQQNKHQEMHFEFGDSIYYLGVPRPLTFFESKESYLDLQDKRLLLFGSKRLLSEPCFRKKQLKVCLNKAVEALFKERLDIQSKRMGLTPKRLLCKWLKSRWGSCSTKGNITLNCCLIGAPLWVIDYVMIHELAHLKHMNHSKSFWDLVKYYDSDYKRAMTWLKEHQHMLMQLKRL